MTFLCCSQNNNTQSSPTDAVTTVCPAGSSIVTLTAVQVVVYEGNMKVRVETSVLTPAFVTEECGD